MQQTEHATSTIRNIKALFSIWILGRTSGIVLWDNRNVQYMGHNEKGFSLFRIYTVVAQSYGEP